MILVSIQAFKQKPRTDGTVGARPEVRLSRSPGRPKAEDLEAHNSANLNAT